MAAWTRPRLVIDPVPADDCFQPASVDLTLDGFVRGRTGKLEGWEICDVARFQFILLSTAEKVTIPDWLVGVVDGKSTWARQGLAVHITAGYIDPGFSGQITLELINVGLETIRLTPGMKICQLRLHQLSSPAMRPYGHPELGSKYQGQIGPTAAKEQDTLSRHPRLRVITRRGRMSPRRS
jgi:deoxycytidine triphosphate deaminase